MPKAIQEIPRTSTSGRRDCRELQNRGGVDAGSAISLAEHLIATLDREDLQIVQRPDDLRDAMELTRKLREEAKGKTAPSSSSAG